MGLRAAFSRAFGRTARMDAPRPSARFTVDIPPEMLEAMRAGGALAPRISRAEALQVPAVLRARNLIAGSLGTLPIRVHGPDRRISTVPWLVPAPDPEIPSSVVMAMTIEDLLFEGISWWRVTAFGGGPNGKFPLEARHVPVEAVHVVPVTSILPSQQQITPDQHFPVDGQVFIDGRPVPDREIIRFDSPNPPLLVHAARAIRTCLKLEQMVSLYADNPLPLGYFSPKEGADPEDPADIQAVLDEWEVARQTRAWGYVNAALDAKTLQWNPEQLQLAEQRQAARLEIALAVGLDPEDLAVSTTSRTYTNREQAAQDRINETLGVYVSAVQDRLSMRDVVPRGFMAEMDFGGFLRGDTLTRMQGYEIGLRVGAYADTDEVRVAENKPDLTPAQRTVRTAAKQPPAQPTQPASNGKAPAMARDDLDREWSTLVGQTRAPERAQFSTEGNSVHIQFDTDETAQSFQVDVERRTITGLLIPWGKVAQSGFSGWRFLPGSVAYSESSISRIKLNRRHDRHDLIGVATRLQSGKAGLTATFKIGRGPEGDKALMSADDGVMDGLSAEIDFDAEAGDGYDRDPADPSVNVVYRTTLRGAALTGNPAFDDARITSVKASHDEGGGMTAPTKSTPAKAGAVPEAVNFDTFMTTLADKIAESQKNATEGLTEKFAEILSEGVKAALENLHDPQTDGPEPVRAARWTVTREAPVYTLNGQGPSLVRDAWYAQMHSDVDARDRVRKFRAQNEDMAKVAHDALHFEVTSRLASFGLVQFTPSSTANAAAVIPPGYRPDLFVPQLGQGRPFVDAVASGVISNATPFVVPVFGSVTGATGDHVEGVNPTDGTLTFTTKTVTPGAISGLLKLTREIVDSSNPAIDQIALFAMRESYNRQTEAKVYALLNGASGQGGVITAGFVPSGAQVSTATGAAGGFAPAGVALLDAIRAAMAVYPFRRFGAPDISLMSQEATSSFAAAKDTTGRPLLPSVGATNAAGIGNALTQGWFVDGLAHVPAWAISGNAAGDADTFMLNRGDVWAWESPLLTFRYEERSGPAHIDLALFGYFGTHLLRPVGLSSVRLTVTP